MECRNLENFDLDTFGLHTELPEAQVVPLPREWFLTYGGSIFELLPGVNRSDLYHHPDRFGHSVPSGNSEYKYMYEISVRTNREKQKPETCSACKRLEHRSSNKNWGIYEATHPYSKVLLALDRRQPAWLPQGRVTATSILDRLDPTELRRAHWTTMRRLDSYVVPENFKNSALSLQPLQNTEVLHLSGKLEDDTAGPLFSRQTHAIYRAKQYLLGLSDCFHG